MKEKERTAGNLLELEEGKRQKKKKVLLIKAVGGGWRLILAIDCDKICNKPFGDASIIWQAVRLCYCFELYGVRFQIAFCKMLQWMGGSRRKVNASRKSTQKRQKQYFEQRKRQQQNLQMRSEDCSDVLGITGQYLKEGRSLDILNLVNLSKNAQRCNSASLKERGGVKDGVSAVLGNIATIPPITSTNTISPTDSCEVEEARAPLSGRRIQTSPKAFVRSPSYPNSALNGLKPSHQKTTAEQQSELSVFDLLYDDEPNITAEEHPTCEDHVSFSLEGLGNVGMETPFHSPQQPARIECSPIPMLKDRRKMKLSKNFNHVLEDLELEVDTMMQDINVAPNSSFSNYTYNKVRKSLAPAEDCMLQRDLTKKGGSSISQEFFDITENSNGDPWGASFLNEKFDDEMKYDTSWKKKPFQTSASSPDFLKDGVYNMASYGNLLPKKRSSATAMEGFNVIESPPSYSKHKSESDFHFFVPSEGRHSRSNGNFNVQNLILEDVTDNSSLLSEESCSSTAVRGETIRHSPSRLRTGENRRKQSYGFASPGNKCRSEEGKSRNMSNPSEQKPSHYTNYSPQGEMGAQNNLKLEERYASVDTDSGAALFRKNLGTKFGVSDFKNRTGDPFGVLNTPELHDKASPSIGGLKNGATVANSPPCSFTSEKFALADSLEFLNYDSWPIRSNLSPKFQFKGNPEDATDFHCETISPNTTLRGSVSKHEGIKVKLQQESCRNLEPGEEISKGHNGMSSEKMARDASISNGYTQESEGPGDTTTKITQSLETAYSPGNVEESSSLLKKSNKHESKAVPIKNNCDAEVPLKFKISNEEEETQNLQPEERNGVGRKHNNEHINSSGQVMMFKSYVLQLFCVQKVLEASMHNV
ncbi:hypothetical protein L6164_030930 [Bauhinia variegata]|uniref:Uncharacterized protein n=1 Tax=Bauhinia variegata TaxID=167791 RepID=A0ACB9LF78_BAUVA|nr:hypothetical protein L6164_030930 [Bauhinia variegata]